MPFQPRVSQFAGADSLLRANYDVRTFLASGVGFDEAGSLPVGSTEGFPPRGTVWVDGELIFYTGKTETSFTGLWRGAFGTAAIPHSRKAAVRPALQTQGVRETINAKLDFGLRGNGATDDTAGLQAAVAQAEATGRPIYLPAGTYLTTGITLTGRVCLFGDGDVDGTGSGSVLYSVSNAPIINCVGGAFLMPAIENLIIHGSKTAGSNQIGIKLDDGIYALNARVENVRIRQTGGTGLYVGKVFSSTFRNIFVDDCEGWPVEVDSEFMPNLLFDNIYPGSISASHPAGFRVRRAQNALFINCNGINSVPMNSAWMVIGRKNGLYGETDNGSATAIILNANIESYHSYGIRALRGSRVELMGHTTFARHNVNSTIGGGGINNSQTSIPIAGDMDALLFPSSGELLIIEGANEERMIMTSRTSSTATVTRGTPAYSFSPAAQVFSCHAIGIEYDVDDVGSFPSFASKGVLHDAVGVQDAPEKFYKNGSFIHANEIPPAQLEGQGLTATQSPPVSTYYNTTRSRLEPLPRVGDAMTRTTITGNTTFPMPGARWIACEVASPTSLNLWWAGWERHPKPVTVVDMLGNAATNPITITAGGGGSINGASNYVLNRNYGCVVLLPDPVTQNWRIISTYSAGAMAGSGTANNLVVWAGGNSATEISGLAYDAGFSALRLPGRLYAGTTGSAGFPAIARTSDEDTGIYFPSANALGFTIGGSDRAQLGNALNLFPYGASAGQTGSLTLYNLAVNGSVTLRAHDTAVSHTVTWPQNNAAGVLTNNGSGVLSWTPNVQIESGAYGSRPTGAEDDVYIATDGNILSRKNASSWEDYGPIWKLTHPGDVGGWTQVNSGGGAAFDNQGNALHITAPGAGANNVRSLVKSVSGSGGYTATALVEFNIWDRDVQAGLILRDSATGKLKTFELACVGGVWKLRVAIWTNNTTSAGAAQAEANFHHTRLLWMQLWDDGGSVIFRFCEDGKNWIWFTNLLRTSHLTADQVGFFANTTDGFYNADVRLLSWIVA